MTDWTKISVQVDLDEAHATVSFMTTPLPPTFSGPRIAIFGVPVSKDPATSEADLKSQAISAAKELMKSAL